MSAIKPIKLVDGNLKQFSGNDKLPNQVDIEELRHLFGELLSDLSLQGIKFKNENLLIELNYFLNNKK